MNRIGEHMRSFRRYTKGFTLIELIVVLAIMSILGLLMAPNLITQVSSYNYSVCINNQEAFLKEFYQKEQQSQRTPSLNDLSGYLAVSSSKASQICPDGGTISVDTAKKQLTCSKHGGIGVEFTDSGTSTGGGTGTGGTGSDTGGTGTGSGTSTGGTTTVSQAGNDILYMNWLKYDIFTWPLWHYDFYYWGASYTSPVAPSAATIDAVNKYLGTDATDEISGLVWKAHRINNNGYTDVVFLAEPDDYWFSSHCYLLYLDGVLYASSSDGELVLGTCYGNVEDTLTYGGWTKVAEYSGG
jgi:prepilin-type N-terminal cleavage/methylation domain-containing protein